MNPYDQDDQDEPLTDEKKDKIRLMAAAILDHIGLTRREVMQLCAKYSGRGARLTQIPNSRN